MSVRSSCRRFGRSLEETSHHSRPRRAKVRPPSLAVSAVWRSAVFRPDAWTARSAADWLPSPGPAESRAGKRMIQTSGLIHNRQLRLAAMHEPMLGIALRPRVEQQHEEGASAESPSPESYIFCGLAAAACSDRQPGRLQPPDPLTPHPLRPDHQTHHGESGNRKTPVSGRQTVAGMDSLEAYVDSSRTIWRKLHSCIHQGSCRPRKSPTDSGEEAKKRKDGCPFL